MRESLDTEHNIPTGIGKLKSPLADLTSYRGNNPADSAVPLTATMGEGMFTQ